MLISNYCDCGDLLTNAIKEVFYLRTGVFHEYSSIGNASLKNKHILIYTSEISFHIFETHNGIMNDQCKVLEDFYHYCNPSLILL